MDRRLSYLGAIPLDLDFNQPQQFAMVSDGNVLQAVMGPSVWADGLALLATSPASLSLVVGPGRMGTVMVVDQNNAGTAAIADSADALMKMGVNLSSTTLTFTPPSTSGQSQVILIQGQVQETDTGSVTIQYWNAANPVIPLAGPGGSGASQNTLRVQRVALQAVAGVPASTGSQTTPNATSGWTPLYTVTLTNGQTTITGAAFAAHPAAPFIGMKLPVIGGAFQALAAGGGLTFNGSDPTQPLAAVKALRAYTVTRHIYTLATTYVPPANLIFADTEVVGGGGGGGGGTGGSGTSSAGGGGGSGGYARAYLTPAQIGAAQVVTIGSYGPGSAYGNNAGGDAGGSSFGGYLSGGGGHGGAGCDAYSGSAPGGGPGLGGAASSTLAGAVLIQGQTGQAGITFSGGASGAGGQGGSSPLGYGGAQGFQTAVGSAPTGQGYGAGGAGAGRSTSGLGGGTGSSGCVIITEYCWAH